MQQQVAPFEDDPSIGERFVDGPIGVNFVNGNMHITFFTLRSDHRAPAQAASGLQTVVPQVRRVSLRVVMPLVGAVDLHRTIDNLLKIMRQQGVITSVMPGSDKLQ